MAGNRGSNILSIGTELAASGFGPAEIYSAALKLFSLSPEGEPSANSFNPPRFIDEWLSHSLGAK